MDLSENWTLFFGRLNEERKDIENGKIILLEKTKNNRCDYGPWIQVMEMSMYQTSSIFRNITIILNYKYNILQMSHLIDSLEVPQPSTYEDLKFKFKNLFLGPVYSCKNVQDKGRQIIFFLKATNETYRLPSVWNCKIGDQVLSIEITLYNKDEDDFIRASTTSMKIQLANIVRVINNYLQMLRPFTRYIVDNQSGALRLHYSIPLLFFRFGVNTEQIRMEITNLFWCLNYYNEVVTFVEPIPETAALKQNLKSESPQDRIQRFQKLLKYTACQKQIVTSSLKRVLQMKHSNRPTHFHMIDITRQIFENNVKQYQTSYFGLEDVSNYIINQELYLRQLAEKDKNQKGKTSVVDKNIDRIVYGLVQIVPKRELTQKQKQAEQQGGHSCIFTNDFEYYVADTIYSGTISYGQEKVLDPTIYAKRKEGSLTYKLCNKEDKVAKNSFLNELAFLKHIRDMASPFIARYYLMAKDTWDQEDTIYMSTYQKNVWRLLNTRNLLMKSKLELCYKIAKGLCFLFSKKILHRDFKHLNVVVDKQLTPKIIDFGSCIAHLQQNGREFSFQPHSCELATSKMFQIRYHQYLMKQSKTFYFNIPARNISQAQFNQHPLFDIFSFGKTICYVFFKAYEPPLPEKLAKDQFAKINQYLLFLIDRCLDHDPQNRPSIGQITAYIGALHEMCSSKIRSLQTEQSSGETEKKGQGESRQQQKVDREKQKVKGREKQKEKQRKKVKAKA